MKRTKLQGYLKDLENKNKHFSFIKTMRLLDIGFYIYSDIIENFDLEKITNYKKSKYITNELNKQFEVVFEFLNTGKILMATCILRNIFEELMYIMATSLDIEIDLSPDTKAGYFKTMVIDNIDELLSNNFEKNDINDIYSHLSKLMHVTNLKEAVSYLSKTNKYNKYISNEIKFLTLMIQYIYIDFYNKKQKISDMKICTNIMLFSSYSEFINEIYFIANSEKGQVHLKKYFYGEKNQKYLAKKNEEIIIILKDFKISKDQINITIKRVSKELNKQLADSKYLDEAKRIINKK